jgi:hypothetical protein
MVQMKAAALGKLPLACSRPLGHCVVCLRRWQATRVAGAGMGGHYE